MSQRWSLIFTNAVNLPQVGGFKLRRLQCVDDDRRRNEGLLPLQDLSSGLTVSELKGDVCLSIDDEVATKLHTMFGLFENSYEECVHPTERNALNNYHYVKFEDGQYPKWVLKLDDIVKFIAVYTTTNRI